MTQAFNLALLANNVNSSGQLNADTGIYNTVNIANGGTNLSATPTNGQLLIGNGTGYTLATLTAGTGMSITNASGAITLTNSQPNAVVDIQTFNAGDADLTWDKPTTGQTMVRIEVWGGGGGSNRAGNTNVRAGGGGGAYNVWFGPISYMGSTETVTVGAAGVGRTGSIGNGTAGGTSSVTLSNYPSGSKTISAYGGGGAGSGVGGGGGGALGAGGSAAWQAGKGYMSNSTYNPISTSSTLANTPVNGDPTGGGLGAISECATVYRATGSIYGGGGGAYVSYTVGGNSMYGGGGGGTTGGTSLFGGNGGSTNTAGNTPSGGGGMPSSTGNGYDGGAGRVVITSW